MVLGNNRFGIDQALDWARAYSAVVVSPEYRLAPEHPDPAPREDCYAGLLWTATHADELGVDADRIVVAGSSAGGGLAAALALLSRDRDGPCLAGQLLVCPMLDDRSFDIDWPAELNGVGTWDVRTSEFAWTALLGDAVGTPEVSAYAAPARAHHLADLPPAYVDVGSAELFAAPAVTYAHRLVTAEVATELHVWPGAFHGFDRVVPDMPLSQAARAARTQWLRNLAARS
jgi:acetyl esterase/lipase